jgi:hypothetical protein
LNSLYTFLFTKVHSIITRFFFFFFFFFLLHSWWKLSSKV